MKIIFITFHETVVALFFLYNNSYLTSLHYIYSDRLFYEITDASNFVALFTHIIFDNVRFTKI